MDLKKSGQKQIFPANYYTQVPVMNPSGFYVTTIPKIVKIPRIFPEDNLHLKYEKFIKECDEKRILVANEDLIQDLKDEEITINDDWDIYTKDLSQFEDGTIRWKSFRFAYSVQDDLNSEVYQRKQEELKQIQIQAQNKSNQQYQEQHRIISLGRQLTKEKGEKEARALIEKEKEEAEKLQSSEINPESPAISNPDGTPDKNDK